MEARPAPPRRAFSYAPQPHPGRLAFLLTLRNRSDFARQPTACGLLINMKAINAKPFLSGKLPETEMLVKPVYQMTSANLIAFWLSRWMTEQTGDFKLDWPWWISGARLFDYAEAVFVAVRASSETAAMEMIMQAHDVRPSTPEVRFCEQKADDWAPFTNWFPRADWMRWESIAP